LYHYWAYGLTVASEIEFPELYAQPVAVYTDVLLVFGKVPAVDHRPNGYYGKRLDITSDEYRLEVKDVAKYHVSQGKKIIIEPCPEAPSDMIRLFCLSNAFAALLHQRRIIPLHGAALLNGDKLVMILGDSGSGKSTTMAALLQKGLQPFSDDVCVPAFMDGEFKFYSSYPMMKFWKSTLEMDGLDMKVDRKIRPDLEKYGLYFHDSFIIEAKQPEVIFILKISDQVSQVCISPIHGISLFQELERNAYRGEYIGATDLQMEHFNFFSRLANQVPCYKIEKPDGGTKLDLITDLIFEKIVS
jgi:hypothetical protein